MPRLRRHHGPDAATVPLASAARQPRDAARLGLNAEIRVAEDPGATATAYVLGELDMTSAPALTAALCAALDERAEGLLVDLSGVEFFDCAALHALERARHHAERRGRPLTLTRTSPAVDLVLRLLESARKQSLTLARSAPR